MAITRQILREYTNGNVCVKLYTDGTKTREWDGEAKPLHPESIDLKITDWCDAGCAWCHESSTMRGKHADYGFLKNLLQSMPYGMEVALGGGDTLSYPKLGQFTSRYSDRLIFNLTINEQHVERYKTKIQLLRAIEAIHGLGVSYHDGKSLGLIVDEDTVVHIIAGVADPFVVAKLLKEGRKVLILGYKDYGRAGRYVHTPEILKELRRWKYFLPMLLLIGGTIAFDNLALEQLKVRRVVGEGIWASHYMGDDGRFTMYVDAIEKMFAKSSTSTRMKIPQDWGVQEMFQHIQRNENEI